MRIAFFTILVICFAALVSACASHEQPPEQSPQDFKASAKQINTKENVQTADYFSMEPARLEKGHIFLRRTASDETKASPEEKPKEKPKTKPKAKEDNSTKKSETKNPEAGKQPNVEKAGQREGQREGQKEKMTHRQQDLLLREPLQRKNRLDALPPHKWQDIRDARINVHVQNSPFKKMVEDIIERIEPRVGPWEVQWKLTRENRDLLKQHFSLNTETTFNKFINSVASYILNLRGIELNFELFEKKRVLIISDVF